MVGSTSWRLSEKGRDDFSKFVLAAFLLFAVITVSNSLFHYFDHDEFEHIHSAWYLSKGFLPYLDFYQGHHPLFWFLLSPFIMVFGPSIALIIILRLFMLFFVFGNVWIIIRLCRLILRSKELSLFSGLFYFSSTVLIEKGIEIRPDSVQLFCGLLSIYFFVRFLQRMRSPDIWRSGFFAAVSFLVLQKSVSILPVFILVLVYMYSKKQIGWWAVVRFVFAFLATLSPLFAYLWLTGSFQEYYVSNWLVHLNLIRHFSPHHTVLGMVAMSPLFWIFMLSAVWIIFSRKRGNTGLKAVSLFWLFSLAGALLVPLPYKQFFLFPLALGIIPVTWLFQYVCFRFRLGIGKRVAFLSAFLLIPFLVLSVMVFITNGKQLQQIRYVLNHSKPESCIYDGDINFNLFRKDLHFFWYCFKDGKEFDTYNQITGGRFLDYDVIALIRERRPQFISDHRLDLKASGLDKWYAPTPFRGLYRRRPREAR